MIKFFTDNYDAIFIGVAIGLIVSFILWIIKMPKKIIAYREKCKNEDNLRATYKKVREYNKESILPPEQKSFDGKDAPPLFPCLTPENKNNSIESKKSLWGKILKR